MTPHELILNYRQFILSAWPQIDNTMNDIDWDDDIYFLDELLEANWEFLVERLALERGEFLSGSRHHSPDAK